MEPLLAESFERFVEGACTPAVVREVESRRAGRALWAEVEASGYLDLLVPESRGGAGLGLRDAFATWLGCGRHALPVPLATTMWARGALATAGVAVPEGAIAIAAGLRASEDGSVRGDNVPDGALADWVLADDGSGAALWPTAAAERSPTGVHGSLHAHLEWQRRPTDVRPVSSDLPLLEAGALITATLMVGAMLRMLEMTVRYANDRVQFGKPIGRFQAVQQQLAVLAEQAFAARIAAEIACTDPGVAPHPLRAALAKARAGEAAEKAAAIAHAVHGAIGVTAEFDLQLFTRRLHQGRGDFGSAPYWYARLGRSWLDAGRAAVPFLLDDLLPSASARIED